jgi:hypothetical protein
MEGRWYVATLIIRSRKESEDKPLLWVGEEQICLIQAPDADAAYEKAVELGREGEVSYENMLGDIVHWEFVGLEDLEWLDEPIQDGTEIRSRFFQHRDPSSLVTEKADLSAYWPVSHNNQHSQNKIIDEGVPFDDDDE